MKPLLRHLTIVFILTALGCTQDVASFEKRITVKQLPNGLTLLVCERPEAPVFSFFTLVDAGSAQDPMRANGTGPHVRAHGFQGHGHRSAPPTTPPRSSRWKKSKPPMPLTSPSAIKKWAATRPS